MYTSSSSPFRIGLACAGGGIEGAVYEIGALCALEEAVDGLDFTNAHVYVGVSAGAIVTASLANGITPRQMSRAILSHQHNVHPITPSTFFSPAYQEYLSRAGSIPARLVSMFWDYLKNPSDLSLTGSLSRMTEFLPVGLFDNSPIREYMQKNFEFDGRTDDFRKLSTKLRIVATDLDTSKSVVFGSPGLDDIPISSAVQASTALPGVYTPVQIKNRYYIDGVAQRTVHASVSMAEGADFTICVNPIVPYEALLNHENEGEIQRLLVDRGLSAVLSQTFRTMIHSRMNIGINRYKQEFAGKDILVIEPSPTDYRMFFTNIFSFASRKEVCAYAYQSTRAFLKANAAVIEPMMDKYGLRLSHKSLADDEKSLYDPVFNTSAEKMISDLGSALSRLNLLMEKIDQPALSALKA
ncbi:MAG: patatin-like phospholipase family protein [Balneolales bacterium]|nr:patatin-like phospholipase family protein [Balneolales bacterium]